MNKYICTAIPYVNAKPHIGNALDYLYADILARHYRAQGETVRFQTGTDEHGNKIALKAAENNLPPQEYVDAHYGNFKAMIAALNATPTDFIRTTDQAHKLRAQAIWKKLQPYIYKGSYSGWYCIGCERFVTEAEYAENKGTCPDHNRLYEHFEEENYYFKLSAFRDKIIAAIDSGELEIVPAFRATEIKNMLTSTLNDVSISRPKKNLSWGVEVPGDPTQVMYVWIDALSNYITVLGYPDDTAWQQWWPASVQIVGKDILRFHAAIWPAMLIGLGLPLPKKILVHGFVNVDGAKMSKTVGNVIDPIDIIEQYGVDALRYYFSRHVPTLEDGDFTWEKFENAYNNELCNELGNLVQRVVAMALRYQAGVIGDKDTGEHDLAAYYEALDDFHFNRAMDEVWKLVRGLNQYIDEVKPWEVAKKAKTDPEAVEHLGEILTHTGSSLRLIGQLLEPFLPGTSAAILKIFGRGVITPYTGVLFPKKYIHTPEPIRNEQKK